jgi:hypothetical protein
VGGRIASWLSLAAAPTFAIMALVTGVLGGHQPDMLCATAHDAWWLGGMVPMYLLMSAFHSAPWLKLIAGRRRRERTGLSRKKILSGVMSARPATVRRVKRA